MSDPIIKAITEHRAAWDAFQVAPDGLASEEANDCMCLTLDALLLTGCATRTGAWSLLDHLRWWLAEEAEYADDYQPAYEQARRRADELAMFLEGTDGSACSPDPILTAIHDAVAADDALTVICATLDETDDQAMRRHNRVSDRAVAARKALTEVVPTTLVGIRALARHYARYEEWPEGFEHLATALERYEPTPLAAIGEGALANCAQVPT